MLSDDFSFGGQGTVSVSLGFVAGDCSEKSSGKRGRCCLLVSVVGCHG